MSAAFEELPGGCTAVMTVLVHDVTNNGRRGVRIIANTTGVELLPDGLGTNGMLPGHGPPLYLECEAGKWRLHVWADINSEDPTHMIDLDGASEVLRRPD